MGSISEGGVQNIAHPPAPSAGTGTIEHPWCLMSRRNDALVNSKLPKPLTVPTLPFAALGRARWALVKSGSQQLRCTSRSSNRGTAHKWISVCEIVTI
jgi:hypothetical protein